MIQEIPIILFLSQIVQVICRNLFGIVAMYLCFALGLSLSVISAVNIVDIVSIILFSTCIIRIVELLNNINNRFNYNMQFCMEVAMIPLLIPSILLETISIGFRSFSLGFRIFANISAGHVLSDIILVLRYGNATTLFNLIGHFTFSYFIVIYEVLVACIQLGVFISLISVYVE